MIEIPAHLSPTEARSLASRLLRYAAVAEGRPRKLGKQQERALANADAIVELYREWESIEAVARRFKVNPPNVRAILDANGIIPAGRADAAKRRRLTERNAEICRRAAAGESYASIGRAYDITGYRVLQIVRRGR
jgi:DNA-binding CsgD family transcriptional regulator